MGERKGERDRERKIDGLFFWGGGLCLLLDGEQEIGKL